MVVLNQHRRFKITQRNYLHAKLLYDSTSGNSVSLHKLNPIKRIIVDTYQSVSGKGLPAIEELTGQTKQVLDGQTRLPGFFRTRLLSIYYQKWMFFWTVVRPGKNGKF